MELSLGDAGGVWETVETGLVLLSEHVTGFGTLKGGTGGW